MSDISGWRNSPLCGDYQKWMAALVVFLIPCIHIGVVNKMLWVPNKAPVNRTSCTCSCFDTVYKGSYESPGKTGYKHIYFNATFDTLIIWIMTFGTIIVAYEAFKRLLNLYSAGNLRWRMLLLFILDIYPNYFSYWVYFNYTNDGFYKQAYHQLFFTTTELFSTWNVFRLCAKDSKVEPVAAMSIIVIGLIHIILGGIDQFFCTVNSPSRAILQKDSQFEHRITRYSTCGFNCTGNGNRKTNVVQTNFYAKRTFVWVIFID